MNNKFCTVVKAFCRKIRSPDSAIATEMRKKEEREENPEEEEEEEEDEEGKKKKNKRTKKENTEIGTRGGGERWVRVFLWVLGLLHW